ncbi:MAG: Trm112 family protein [Bacteriovoracaceae bacterium]|nr:Trm112 family protein [Bacteroidota bacterium]
MIQQDLLEIICCPNCKGDLTYNEQTSTLTCASCENVFEVADGIPILLPKSDGK